MDSVEADSASGDDRDCGDSRTGGDQANLPAADDDSSAEQIQDGGMLEEMNGDDEYETDSETEDGVNDLSQLFPGQRLRRKSQPELPDTVTLLETASGGKVYLLGTAHFSQQSMDDVSKAIMETQPDVVVLELCPSRVSILQLDEETLLREAKNIDLSKLRTAIAQGGVIQGILHILLLSMSAHLTKQLGMAPGGEFRTAFREAKKIPGCRLQLGDRPIQVTLKRAFASLSWWQKLRLAWYMITSKDPISAEEVEKCKQKDLLEEMLREMTGEFPHISRVFVDERDIYLAHSIRHAAHPIPPLTPDGDWIPCVVVAVVGIGHVAGIVQNWDSVTGAQVAEVMQINTGSGGILRWAVRVAVLSVVVWAGYGLFNKLVNNLSSV